VKPLSPTYGLEDYLLLVGHVLVGDIRDGLLRVEGMSHEGERHALIAG
jgi:hypothetical protein